jgi:hypothetical protein
MGRSENLKEYQIIDRFLKKTFEENRINDERGDKVEKISDNHNEHLLNNFYLLFHYQSTSLCLYKWLMLRAMHAEMEK